MSVRATEVRPTKIEFIKLRRRLNVAKRVHKILKERATILVSELLSLTKEAIAKRAELNEELNEAYMELIITYGQIGAVTLAVDSMATQRDLEIEFLSQSSVGVRIPLIEASTVMRVAGARGLTLLDETISLQRASEHFEKITGLIIELAELEKGIELIGLEVKAMRRKVNILEHFIIPRMQEKVSYLSMKFEEREREEKARLKRTKAVLVRGGRL